MFILTTLSDLVQISPEDVEKPSGESIQDNINAKYANKVIQKIGLCICIYDILNASDGLIGHGTGIMNVNVEFRLIVFRPFKGEIMLGQISGASEYGMKSTPPFSHDETRLMTPRTVRLDFFDDILIPPNLMFPKSFFNVQEQVWTWVNDGDEYFYDKNEWVRVRVEDEQWNDISPSAPSERGNEVAAERKSPYSITVSVLSLFWKLDALNGVGFDVTVRTGAS
ncbi:MAG: DNA-directed RNA polymerase III subunit rpc25 [Alectoria fallacina]|uniref:DNA-directed RNA polymerase subunit n=1 Tax=Alectoria fallacina TaxID=1903189 RepID=A0A8H3EPN7_9LECA|nr:MAG: DNA-directed RNA polymerase III subunit rpc25 [Alectoria fallacina]